ncbi:MAG TPA: hypothetical protein VGH42_08840 [Verrucomicrobiae bacterium]|jgi:hypothetical protein
MTISNTPGAIKKFKRSSWSCQMTFVTPLKKLDVFVPAIFSALEPVREASVTIDGYAFEPKNLLGLMSRSMLSEKLQRNITLTVVDQDKVKELLRTALSDWLDFAFIPVLKLFVIYADHDEYTTFYANTKSNLERIRLSLSAKGLEAVRNYERRF